MISRAGLVLNPGQVADLVLAWRQVAQLSALIPRDRPLVDDFAPAFRLPPPQPRRRAVAKPRPAPAAKSPTPKSPAPKSNLQPRAKSSAQPGTPKRPARRKTAAKRR